MKLISVRFKNNGKEYYFYDNDLILNKDDYVLVNTEKGLQLAIVSNVNIEGYNPNLDYKSIEKIADKKDYDKFLKNSKEAMNIMIDTRKKIEKDDIQMSLVDVMYTFDKSQLIFNFIANERIDFRDLVKYLAAKYKTRIEMHQIGVRDKAKEIGGIGQCGRKLCCNSFKTVMDGISINMAKNQGISLNPNKINGCCGRLLCCLSYEDDCYTYNRDKLPKINDDIIVDGLKGKVVKVDIINCLLDVDVNDSIKKVKYNVE